MFKIKSLSGEVLHSLDAETLYGADLAGLNLDYANLEGQEAVGARLTGSSLVNAHMRRAVVAGADMTDTDLTGADLASADLSSTILSRACMRGATLFGATLSAANLSGADLSGAEIINADLTLAQLCGTNLTQSSLWNTTFAGCDTLKDVKGLDQVIHEGPSILDNRTLRACVTKLPDVFLEGVGYNREEIEYLRAMYADGAIRYYSCFLSHASDDAEFADRLYDDLRTNNVSCWHYRFDMKGGDYWRPQINEAIRTYDKTVVVCSERSLRKVAVIEEILGAMRTERQNGTKKLFPIKLDEFLFSDEMTAVVDSLPPTCKPEDWWEYVPYYHIPDFSHWKDHEAYKREFEKLLRDLKAQPTGG